MVKATTGKACQFLGRCDDQGSYYAFPTDANCCYSKERPAPIAPNFQSTACLAEGWEACRRYQAAVGGGPIAEPVPGAARELPPSSDLPWVPIAAAAVGLLLLVVFLILRPKFDGADAESATLIPRMTLTAVTEQALLTATQAAVQTPATGASPSPTSTQTFTPTPSATPSRTPTPTPSHTATPTPSWTPTPSQTPTPSRTPTRTPSPSPTPTPTATAGPTPVPTATVSAATPTPIPAPILVDPPDGRVFAPDVEIVLTWRPAVPLPPDARYVVTVSYTHIGANWDDEGDWIEDTSWTLSEERPYLRGLADSGILRWSVQIMLQTGMDAGGKPMGVPLSAPSEVRSLIWSSGEAPGPEPTIPPP